MKELTVGKIALSRSIQKAIDNWGHSHEGLLMLWLAKALLLESKEADLEALRPVAEATLHMQGLEDAGERKEHVWGEAFRRIRETVRAYRGT